MPLTEATIRRLSPAQSFSRSEEYYASGAVLSLERRGGQALYQDSGMGRARGAFKDVLPEK